MSSVIAWPFKTSILLISYMYICLGNSHGPNCDPVVECVYSTCISHIFTFNCFFSFFFKFHPWLYNLTSNFFSLPAFAIVMVRILYIYQKSNRNQSTMRNFWNIFFTSLYFELHYSVFLITINIHCKFMLSDLNCNAIYICSIKKHKNS